MCGSAAVASMRDRDDEQTPGSSSILILKASGKSADNEKAPLAHQGRLHTSVQALGDVRQEARATSPAHHIPLEDHHADSSVPSQRWDQVSQTTFGSARVRRPCHEIRREWGSYEPLPGLKINGRLTMGEIIGDLSGLAVAYRAYHISLHGASAPVIDGFTGDQRFFMGYRSGATRCEIRNCGTACLRIRIPPACTVHSFRSRISVRGIRHSMSNPAISFIVRRKNGSGSGDPPYSSR